MTKSLGVSVILVIGGSGDYFDVADTVVQMDMYRPMYEWSDCCLAALFCCSVMHLLPQCTLLMCSAALSLYVFAWAMCVVM